MTTNAIGRSFRFARDAQWCAPDGVALIGTTGLLGSTRGSIDCTGLGSSAARA
jgi:hypothetical protein